ncbi:MAG: OmpW family protein, partial [Mesorhizobium sp.]
MARTRMGVARAIAAAVALIIVGQQAVAAEPAQAETVLAETGASVTEAPSPWQVRLRGLGVVTKDLGYVDTLPGSGLSYSNTVTPELDISYFFNDNIAAELILGTTY